jgi:glycosyltransferase involved in cell wall biosynthesis
MFSQVNRDAIDFYWYVKNTIKALYWFRKKLYFKNIEGKSDYNFVLPAQSLQSGISAMLRVKNEERKIRDCLASIFNVFTEIVVIDNGSTDNTLEIVRCFKQENDRYDKLKIFTYPHQIARCGEEHFSKPADSVHSLVYYYNWCLSRCICSYVCKWDADMLLHKDGQGDFKQFMTLLLSGKPTVVALPVQKLYRDLSGNFYLGKGEIYEEIRLFPNCSAVHFHKATHWEQLGWSIDVDRKRFSTLCIYEIKDASEDEFSHWTSTNFGTKHKEQEYQNFQSIKGDKIANDNFEKLGVDFMASTAPYII